MVTSSRYLGRVISAADVDWPAVVLNLAQARAVWRRMARILIREGARPRVYIFFLKPVVQLGLLFGAETWVLNPGMGQVLGGIHDQVAWQLAGWFLRRRKDRKWEYTSAEAARVEVGY